MAKQTESRALEAILKVLRRNNVAKYQKSPDGTVSVEFRDTSLQDIAAAEALAARGLGAASAAEEASGNSLGLPDGLFDPISYLKKLNAKYNGAS